MASRDSPRWARTTRPHRLTDGYAVVAGDRRDALTELSRGAAALFEEVATPRTSAELANWLDLDDSARLHALIAELEQAHVLVAGGSPTAGGRQSPIAIEAGSDPRGIVLTRGMCPCDATIVHDQIEAVHLAAWAERGRVVPLLAQALREEAVVVPDSISAMVSGREREIQRAAVLLELELLTLTDWFDTAGLEFVVLKGLATAHLDHGSPALRQTSDIDILLGLDDVAPAAALLVGKGATVAWGAEVGTVTKATTVRLTSGIEVDLHARPVMLPYGAVDLLPPVSYVIGETKLRALDRPDRWAHAVAHYALSSGPNRRPSSLRDVLATWPAPDEHALWDDAIERWQASTLLRVVEADLKQLDLTLSDEAWLQGRTEARPRWFELELVRHGLPGPMLHWAAPLTVLRWPQRLQHVRRMAIERRRHPRTANRDESNRQAG